MARAKKATEYTPEELDEIWGNKRRRIAHLEKGVRKEQKTFNNLPEKLAAQVMDSWEEDGLNKHNFSDGLPKSSLEMDRIYALKVASLAAVGLPIQRIAFFCGLNQKSVRRIMKLESTQMMIMQVSEASLACARNSVKTQTAELANKAVKVITHHLNKNNLKAAEMVLKTLGVGELQALDTKEKGITIVLATDKPQEQIVASTEHKTVEENLERTERESGENNEPGV